MNEKRNQHFLSLKIKLIWNFEYFSMYQHQPLHFPFKVLYFFCNGLHYPIVLTQHYVHLEITPVLNEKYDIYESEFMKDTTFDWSMSLIFHQLIFLTEFWILFIWQKGNIKNMSSSSEIVWMKREPPPTRIRILTRARK